MRNAERRFRPVGLLVGLLVLAVPAVVFGQSDEIQVYDGGLAAPGVVNLTWHNNVVARGQKAPAFPGAVTANKSLNGVPEFALGVTDWFEAGLYLPLYSRDSAMGWGLDGFKLRALFAVPHAEDRRFFYGANYEFSVNARRWDPTRITSEIRPIVGWHLSSVDIVVNPILDTAWDGFGNLEFAPSARVAYNPTKRWAVAIEEYADYGPLRAFNAPGRQSHQLFGVVNYTGRVEIEAGVGAGLTGASDKLVFKLLVAKDLGKTR